MADANEVFVLIIEDDPHAAFIYKKALTDNRYRVEHIANGKEAQEQLKTLKPDVILLDMNLPDVDGMNLLRQIRASAHNSEVPVILATAYLGMADQAELEGDVSMVLIKPVTYLQIKNLVSRIVSMRNMPVRQSAEQKGQISDL